MKLKRHFMKSSAIKRLMKEVLERLGGGKGAFFPKKSRIEKVQVSAEEIAYFVDRRLQLLQIKEQFIPSLIAVFEKLIELPVICVDEGAIPYILKGADIMVPGITESDEFAKGDVVAIYEETKTKPLGVGIALMRSSELKKTTHGKAIKNLHYLRDKFFQIAEM